MGGASLRDLPLLVLLVFSVVPLELLKEVSLIHQIPPVVFVVKRLNQVIQLVNL